MYRVLSEIITYKLVSVLLFQTRHSTYSSFSLSIVDGPRQMDREKDEYVPCLV